MSGVFLLQFNTRLRLLRLLYEYRDVAKNNKHAFSLFYTLIKHGLSTNQDAQGPIYITMPASISLRIRGRESGV